MRNFIPISVTIKKEIYEKIKATQGDLTLSKRILILLKKGLESEERERQ